MPAKNPAPDSAIRQLHDRVRGCIIGGTLGDAMGGPFEGQRGPLRFKEHTDWSISDDSQLTLATCESIVETNKVSAEHIAQRFVAWYRARRITGAGSSTLKALRDLDAGNHWALAGAKGEMAAGNGAAMRIAPLAFHLDPEDNQDRLLIRDVSRITHHNEEAYVGALAMVIAIRALAFAQSSPADILQTVTPHLPDSRVRDRLIELSSLTGETIEAIATKFGTSGYVVDSVPLALFAVRLIETLPFDKLLIKVIEAGGDTDTNASMTGQLAGTWIGAAKIPNPMIESSRDRTYIQNIANEFANTVSDQSCDNLN
jgi:ADP-ribosyl-[dinitrogen reductase] hydrolase